MFQKVRLDREGTEVSKEEEEAPQVAEVGRQLAPAEIGKLVRHQAPSVFSLVEALKKVDVCTILYLAQEWESAVVGPKGSDEQYRQVGSPDQHHFNFKLAAAHCSGLPMDTTMQGLPQARPR